jgi:NADH:ubiquinone oxidoreductase subunit E
MKTDTIERIVDELNGTQGSLIGILEEIQAKYGFLSEEALRTVSRKTGRSLVDIYGVATFYKAFSLKPRGKHLVSACLGTACHVRGAPGVVEALESSLGIKAGDTTKDREFTLETVRCLGACALGPIVVADGVYFSNVDPRRVTKILDQVRNGKDSADLKSDPRVFPVEVSCPRCNHSLMDGKHPIDERPSIKVTVSFGKHHGWVRMSSLYGSFNVESESEIPAEEVVNFFCPHCHAELNGALNCVECGAPMVSMIVRAGGVAQVCSRRGCRAHNLDLTGVNT